MIVPVDPSNIQDAAVIYSVAWQDSHRSFCDADFVALHTPAHQEAYLQRKIDAGSKVFLLMEPHPIGIVSLTDSMIEDLYVLPEYQNHGYGSGLLHFALSECADSPTLWILENNHRAERLYRREGFTATGRRNAISEELDEIEFALRG